MALRIFNTRTRQVEEFIPRDKAGQQVGMYCCGPTVYDFGHIGNFRTFVFADLVRRYLEFRGYRVTYVMNVTDVEDKIIQRVRSSGKSLREYTGQYEAAFVQDMKVLGCLTPDVMPRATEHIQEIIDLIQKLMDRGVAYQAADGSVYFSIEKYQGCGCRYGQLLNLNFDQMRPGERVERDEYDKDSVADFALWKARVPEDGDVHWPSPWGDGRPGWHIECSAMSMKQLGPSFDLHLGGEDLIFPHHEDEIAQSEGAGLQAEGEPFVRYWIHGAHLLVEGKKMSKSLGNFFTLRDLLDRGFGGREIRYLLISAHYRETFNFTLEGLSAAQRSLRRLDECLDKLAALAAGLEVEPKAELSSAVQGALDDDLNVSAAWGEIFEWVRRVNKQLAANELSKEQAAACLADWRCVDRVLGLGGPTPPQTASAEVLRLLEERQEARRARDFARADALRAQLEQAGWAIVDTPEGSKLKPI